MHGFLQVPVLAYKDEKTQQPHAVYESLICNEFLEVCFCMHAFTNHLYHLSVAAQGLW